MDGLTTGLTTTVEFWLVMGAPCWLKGAPHASRCVALCCTALFVGLAAMRALCVVLSLASANADLAPVAIAGFVAQLVDGSLGMGYGITSSSVLLASGLSPTAASAAVHLAQLGTTAISGLAHFRCGNVDGVSMAGLTTAGVLGAAIGSTLLVRLPSGSGYLSKQVLSAALLFCVGVYVLRRFALVRDDERTSAPGAPPLRMLVFLGVVGGFVDATGGGGWGPVATSGLLADGRLSPTVAIGTVSASEFFVTITAVLGLLFTGGGGATGGAGARVVAALVLGGVLAAPAAPRVCGRLDSRALGVLVGGFVCLSNARVLLLAAAASDFVRGGVYGALLALLVAAGAKLALEKMEVALHAANKARSAHGGRAPSPSPHAE